MKSPKPPWNPNKMLLEHIGITLAPYTEYLWHTMIILGIPLDHLWNTHVTPWKRPWYTLKTNLKHPWNTLRISGKYRENTLQTSLKQPWKPLETPRIHHWYTQKKPWNTHETPLKHPWNTHEIPWIYVTTPLHYHLTQIMRRSEIEQVITILKLFGALHLFLYRIYRGARAPKNSPQVVILFVLF